MLSHLVATLLLIHINNHVPTALAIEDGDRHDREDEDRNINDEGQDTEFRCNVLNGKFRTTSGPNAILRYAYEMEYLKGKSPIYLSSRVTDYIGKGIIAAVFEGCKDFDNRRRILGYTTLPSPSSFHKESSGRSLAATGNDLIVGFETTPEVKPIWEVECTEPSIDHNCMIFSGGITIYFPDNKRERRMQDRIVDFSESFSEGDYAIQEIHRIVKNTIESGNIPQKVLAIEKLTYKILPVTDEPTNEPSSYPTFSPSSSPSLQPSLSISDSPSNAPTSEPTDKPSVSPTVSPSKKPSYKPSSMYSSFPSDAPAFEPIIASPSNSPTFSDSPSASPTFISSEENTPNEINAVNETFIDESTTSVQVGPWAWALMGVSIFVFSFMVGVYIKKRQMNKATYQKQQDEEEEMEAEDLILDSQVVPPIDIVQPLAAKERMSGDVFDESRHLP